AVRGYRTTWGSVPFKDQVLDEDAAVGERLDAVGAVLVAKLALGELAWGGVWVGGMARNPWKPERGWSGPSAGPAPATRARAGWSASAWAPRPWARSPRPARAPAPPGCARPSAG